MSAAAGVRVLAGEEGRQARMMEAEEGVLAAHRLVARVEVENRRRLAEAHQVRARALAKATAAGCGLRRLAGLLGVTHPRVLQMRDGQWRDRDR